MSLSLSILLTLAGLVLLAGGGELLVRGAISTARLLRVSPAVIGLTIVALATSLPELAVSTAAALRGSPDVAVGNVVGSNIFNIAAILGVTAIAFPPLRFRANLIRLDVAVMTVSAILAVLFSRDLMVSRVEGIILLSLLTLFLLYRARNARETQVPHGEGDAAEIKEELDTHIPSKKSAAGSIVLIVIGAGILTGGADVLVRGAIGIATIAGISERVIALTLVSAGTGLPELATAILAGLRKHSAVAVGNIIGSNIFNVFGILGTVSIVKPVPVSTLIAGRDMWWMLGLCLVVILAVLIPGRRLSRIEGFLVFGAYVFYLTTLL